MRGGIYSTGGQIALPVLGDFSFLPDPDPTVTDYQLHVLAQGTTTPILATKDLWKPAPDLASGVITVNIANFLNALGPGNYHVTLVSVKPGGNVESTASNDFTVPLS